MEILLTFYCDVLDLLGRQQLHVYKRQLHSSSADNNCMCSLACKYAKFMCWRFSELFKWLSER